MAGTCINVALEANSGRKDSMGIECFVCRHHRDSYELHYSHATMMKNDPLILSASVTRTTNGMFYSLATAFYTTISAIEFYIQFCFHLLFRSCVMPCLCVRCFMNGRADNIAHCTYRAAYNDAKTSAPGTMNEKERERERKADCPYIRFECIMEKDSVESIRCCVVSSRFIFGAQRFDLFCKKRERVNMENVCENVSIPFQLSKLNISVFVRIFAVYCCSTRWFLATFVVVVCAFLEPHDRMLIIMPCWVVE